MFKPEGLGKWIRFVEMQTKIKTRIFYIENRESGSLIGEIRWYGPFRKYSFFPAAGTVYEKNCLDDITNALRLLEEERKAQLSKS